ncbi:MAG: hypothetical protein HGA31_05485 [Candidatus Moranbacteria bacterium]|nr:hypothetical protein [Candidatus Moranbacteria bacterium]
MSNQKVRHIAVFSHDPDQPACQYWSRGFGLNIKRRRHSIVHKDDPQIDMLVTCSEETDKRTGIKVHRNTVRTPAGEVLARAVTYMTGNSAERQETFREFSGEQAAELVVALG